MEMRKSESSAISKLSHDRVDGREITSEEKSEKAQIVLEIMLIVCKCPKEGEVSKKQEKGKICLFK